jgi:hypothetical protein
MTIPSTIGEERLTNPLRKARRRRARRLRAEGRVLGRLSPQRDTNLPPAPRFRACATAFRFETDAMGVVHHELRRY